MPTTRRQGIMNRSKAKSKRKKARPNTRLSYKIEYFIENDFGLVSQADLHSLRTTI
jgi:hypothetical protein